MKSFLDPTANRSFYDRWMASVALFEGSRAVSSEATFLKQTLTNLFR
ncbi:MAG: hypothetical protein H7Z75_12005 [Ferruginibacter sp.]|nr:hypothetical protein [Cytophagales bacterium]